MAAEPIWDDVRSHLVDLFKATVAFADVDVFDGWPGDNETYGNDVVVVDDEVESDASMPLAVNGAKPYDDIFEVAVVAHVRNRPTRAATRERLAELTAAIHTAMAADPSLADLDGVLTSSIIRRTRVVASSPDGFMARGVVTVRVHSRLSPF